jgi:long-chain fatty acid transport protein
MKRSIKLALSATALLSTTSAFATNGTNLIGYSAQSRAMGGTSLAVERGSESGLSNPALISGKEGLIGGTWFAPDVSFNGAGAAATYAKSASDKNIIPTVAMAYEVNDNFTWGISMFGSAGMGTDYRDASTVTSGTNQMFTNLQLMKFSVPLAYKNENGFSIGVAPVIQYGTLSIGYTAQNAGSATGALLTSPSGMSQDIGTGFEVGMAYDMDMLSFGAVYKSAISMNYKNQISTATQAFGVKSGVGFGDKLTQPSEIGLGMAFKMSGHTVAFDWRQYGWGSADGYEQFKWEDQNVYSVGYEFAKDKWALRAGYNYAKSPIKEQTAASMATDYDGAVINYFNLAGFPATVEQHITFGGGYNFNDSVELNVAYVYSPEVSESFNTTAMTQAMTYQGAITNGATPAAAAAAAGAVSSTAANKHSQYGITADLTFKF